MRRKAVKFALLFFAFLVLTALTSVSEAKTIYVPDDYAKIQWAVDNASAGDMIVVRDGTYNENVDVNIANLTIRSENGSASTIVQAAHLNDHVAENTGVSYLIVHALNPEGVEIASIEGMDPHCVKIYDSDILIGYSAHDNETYNKPIAISPGNHTIRVIFNGMTLEQNIDIQQGETKQLIFIFKRVEHDITWSIDESIEGSWSWTRTDLPPQGVTKTSGGSVYNAKFSARILSWCNCCNQEPWLSAQIEGAASFHLDNTYCSGSSSISGSASGAYCDLNAYVGVSPMGSGAYSGVYPIDIPDREDFIYWYSQYILDGCYPGARFSTTSEFNPSGYSSYFIKPTPPYLGKPIRGETGYHLIRVPADRHYKGIIFIMCPIVSSGVGFSHCWDDFFSLSDSDSDSIEGSLTHFKFSSVPYDILGTGIKYKEIQPPVASFTYSPESPKVGEEITFDASSSYDTDGTIVKYEWDFGDGNRTEGEVVKHAYSKAGNYTVKLTVTDNDGLQDSISKAVFVGNAIFIADARSDKDTYCLNEDVAIRCMVLDEAGNEVWDADVSADIKKPNGSTETISLKPVRDPFSSPFNPRYMYYEGIFTPAPGAGTYENAIGTYSVTIHAKRGEYKDSANLSFDVIAGRLAGRVWYIGFSKGKVTEILKAKGAKVIIKSKDGLVIASLTTDSNGGFKLDSIKPGSYVIDVFWQQGDKSVHYTREVDIPNCGAIWVEFPCNMSELMKRLYKAKALEDYSRLKLRYIAITRDYEIQKTGISLITLPYSAVDAARKASIRLFAEKLFVSHAQDTISDILVGMFQSAAYKQIEQLRKIGNDPPDTDYTEVFKPEMPEPIILPPDYQGIFTDSIVRLANALANQSAIEEALLVSFERYQGALKAGEPEFMRMQLEAIMHYSNLLRENERELKQLIPLVRGEIQSFEDEIGATVQEFQERLSSEGFTPEEEQELRNMGFTDEDLETYKQLLLSFNFTYVLKGLDDLQTSSQSRAESASNLSNQSSEVLSFLTQISGCYIGAYLGGGPEDISSESIQEFNQRMGKPHAIFVRYVDIKDSKNPAHWEWAEEVKRNGAMPMFIYDPWDGLDAIDMTDVEYFASKCKELNVPVFVVFGHEMNLPFYPWGNQPEKYKEKFKEVAEAFHKIAPNVEMCWVPNQNWGYPWGGTDYGDGYSEYYPEEMGTYGEYVDWVGLNFYEKDWDEDNLVPPDMFIANIRNGQDGIDFYETFVVEKNKPMLIAETGAFDPNKDPTPPGERNPLNETEQAEFKNEWIKQVYNVSTLKEEFPRLNAICYFHVNKTETVDTRSHSFYNIVADCRIPESPNVYKNLISDPYFIGAENQPPITSFTYSPENPVVNQTITFNASSSYDPDGKITAYEWDFGDGNITNTTEEVISHSYSESGSYKVTLTVKDDKGAKNSTTKIITVYSGAIFDTSSSRNPYPSIMGTHKGTITPNKTIIATKLYTYPCEGTGGHTEYARIWNETWEANATWEGYTGDWHNISFDKTAVLLAGETYFYEIRTGSYPQIHHTDALLTANGWINCTEFKDTNGKVYHDWIPAIKLF